MPLDVGATEMSSEDNVECTIEVTMNRQRNPIISSVTGPPATASPGQQPSRQLLDCRLRDDDSPKADGADRQQAAAHAIGIQGATLLGSLWGAAKLTHQLCIGKGKSFRNVPVADVPA